MGLCYPKTRAFILALTLTTSDTAFASPLCTQHETIKASYLRLHASHHRQAGVAHISPWQAPYLTSCWYCGGPGAEMGLVAQGIIPPPRHPHYAHPAYYWNNYFYYPNYRDIYEF